MKPSVIGQIAIDFWNEIPIHYPMVSLDSFVIMPDHLHGIIHIKRAEKHKHQINQFGIQSRNLAAIVRAFKSSVKRFANHNQIDFDWQSRYYDCVIRDRKALFCIRKYIKNNVKKWKMGRRV